MDRPYELEYERALLRARELLARTYKSDDITCFEGLIDRVIAEVVEDPARAVEKRFLPDAALAEGIKTALAETRPEAPHPDTPEGLLLESRRKQGALASVEESRFLDGQIQMVAVPDGKGSYLVDTVGTPGRWEVVFASKEPDCTTTAAAATRLLDTLCDILFNDAIPQEFGQLPCSLTGEDDRVVIVDDVSEAGAYLDEGATLYLPSDSALASSIAVGIENTGCLKLYVASRLLALSRSELRRVLRDAFPTMAPTTSTTEERKPPLLRKEAEDRQDDSELPGVVMLDYSGTSGPYVVSHALEMKGYPTQVVKPGEAVCLENPGIFCVSLATQPLGLAEVGNHLKSLRATIDEHFPGSFIIMGGPSAKHPKAPITLYPEINMLIRGEGEEVLPEVLRIIGRTRTTDGLSREQIAALKTIDGLFLHSPGYLMFNNLDRVNAPHDFDVPLMFHYGTFSLYRGGDPIASRTIINPDIARGCPFRCRFCSMAMGWKQRYAAFEKFQKYVLGMLAVEMPLPPGTEDDIAAALLGNTASTAPRDDWFPTDAYRFPKNRVADVANILNRSLSDDLSSRGLLAADARLLNSNAIEALLNAPGCQPPTPVTRSQVNAVIVEIRRLWLATLLEKDEDLHDHGLDHKLEILLEDDNTLCNREYIETFCRWVIDSGLNRYMRFGGGQTSVTSFLRKGEPDEPFIRLLRDAGCCEVEMGVDGVSNNTLKQNDKRGYRLGDAIRVIAALTRNGISGASNRLYSAPHSSRVDLVESLLLGAIAPLGGRSLGGVFIITVPGSQYTNEFAVCFPEKAASQADFEMTYGADYAYAWGNFPEYVPLEHHLYPYSPEASDLIESFAPIIKIEREDKYVYDIEREAGAMTHELGILEKLKSEGLENEIAEVICRWHADNQTDPEMRALGEIIRIRRAQGSDDFSIFREILAETYHPGDPKTFTDILHAAGS